MGTRVLGHYTQIIYTVLLTMVLTKLLLFLLVEYTVCQYAPGVPPPIESNDIKFHEPSGSPPPAPSSTTWKGQAKIESSHRHHADIRLNLEKEREHIKAQVKEEYMDAKDLTKMDDNRLLMQYFRKHDTDKNHKLDGLELLKAIAGMEADDHHHDEDEDNEDEAGKEAKEPSGHIVNIDQIIPIIDSILEQDDKNKDGYLNWPEFISRQRTKS